MAKPNIILILADDMGYSDIGCYGSEIRTPNLDRLGRGGVRFTQTYSCARCCPSRASLLTGLYPHQAGVGHMLRDFGLPGYHGYLNDRCITLGEVLRTAGYETCYSGKWHVGGQWVRRPEARSTWTVGDPRRPLPFDRGFDRFYGNPAGGGSYFNVVPLFDQQQIVDSPDGFYSTDAYTDAAIRMIDSARAASRPFFLHLCYNAPHWPLHALPEDIERYRGTYRKGWDSIRTARHEELKGLGILDRRWLISPRDEHAPPWSSVTGQDWEDSRMAVYAAQIDRMDRNIGRLVKHLEEEGVLDDTLILFLSDNGGCAEFLAEDGRKDDELPFTREGRPVRVGNIPGLEPGGADTFMSYDLPWANASNAPFRLFKHWVHEGGISTPLIAHWPAVTPAGAISHEPNHLVDIAATIIDIAGAAYPRVYDGRSIVPLEGESFAALLRGGKWARSQPIGWEHEGNRAVRMGQWKLVSKYPGPWELYDMERDRTELDDLAAREPRRVAEMSRWYEDWARRCDVADWQSLRAKFRLPD